MSKILDLTFRKRGMTKEQTKEEYDRRKNPPEESEQEELPPEKRPDYYPTTASEVEMYFSIRQYIEKYFCAKLAKQTNLNMMYGGFVSKYCKFFNIPLKYAYVPSSKYPRVTLYPKTVLDWFFTGPIINGWIAHRETDELLSTLMEKAAEEKRLFALKMKTRKALLKPLKEKKRKKKHSTTLTERKD